MIALLLALAVPVLAQEAAKPAVTAPAVTQVSGQVSQRTDYLESQVGQLLSGKPTITGVPNFQNGIQIAGVQLSTAPSNSVSTTTLGEVLISSVGFTSVSVATFSLINGGSINVLQSSTPYHVHCFVQAVAGSSFPTLVIGNGSSGLDFAQHYAEGGASGQTLLNTGFGGVNTFNYFSWHMKSDATSQAAGNQIKSDVYFDSVPSSTNTLRMTLQSNADDSGTSYLNVIAAGAYQRVGGNYASIAFCGSSGALGSACSANKTYSGYCYLYQGPQHQ